MARCQLYNEDECIGPDCLGRTGTPCIFDITGQAGTDDTEEDEENYADYSEDE